LGLTFELKTIIFKTMEEKADLSQKERKVYEIGYILDPDL